MNEVVVSPVSAVPAPVVKGANPYERVIWVGSVPLEMTARQKVVVETYVKTRSYKACVDALKASFSERNHVGRGVIKRWLETPLLKREIQSRLEERLRNIGVLERYKGEDGKGLWLREMLDYRDGKRSGQDFVEIMRDVAEVLGFNAGERGGLFSARNMQVNILQADGEL